MSAESERKNRIKETLKKLRSERAEQLKAAQIRLKETVALRNRIRKALLVGPQTVPDLARSIGETTDRTLLTLMEMRAYGIVAEDAQDGDYFRYRLVPDEKEGA
jgi:predicted Rossmann fold nucleotide-binding protein DprA/Smf involved in DNA uptake